jgi:probable rRNA maturation factor
MLPMIEINNLTDEKVDLESVRSTVFQTLKLEGKDIDISIAIVPSEEIWRVNKQYRDKDKATDVLSFEDINEIMVCLDEVRKNGENFNDEFKKVLIHGTLHVLGYDHEKDSGEMLQKQDQYFNLIK